MTPRILVITFWNQIQLSIITACNKIQFLPADQLCAPMYRINMNGDHNGTYQSAGLGDLTAPAPGCDWPPLFLLLQGHLSSLWVKVSCRLRVSVCCVSRGAGAYRGALDWLSRCCGSGQASQGTLCNRGAVKKVMCEPSLMQKVLNKQSWLPKRMATTGFTCLPINPILSFIVIRISLPAGTLC